MAGTESALFRAVVAEAPPACCVPLAPHNPAVDWPHQPHPFLLPHVNPADFSVRLRAAAGADVVQVKGRTLLFSDTAVPTPELLAQARQRHDSKRVRRESKATAKQPVTLAPPVQSQLAALHRAGCVPQDAFDNSSLG